MSHFAQIDGDNKVINIIVADQEYIDSLPDPENYKQVSINTSGGVHRNPDTGEENSKSPLRKNYPGVGWKFDPTTDSFERNHDHVHPFPSWKFNKELGYFKAPKPYPSDGKDYAWVEDDLEWQEWIDIYPDL